MKVIEGKWDLKLQKFVGLCTSIKQIRPSARGSGEVGQRNRFFPHQRNAEVSTKAVTYCTSSFKLTPIFFNWACAFFQDTFNFVVATLGDDRLNVGELPARDEYGRVKRISYGDTEDQTEINEYRSDRVAEPTIKSLHITHDPEMAKWFDEDYMSKDKCSLLSYLRLRRQTDTTLTHLHVNGAKDLRQEFEVLLFCV